MATRRPSDDHKRPDVLVREARERLTVSRLGSSYARETDRDLIVIRYLADALEAATGGMHIDAKHWAEVARLRAKVKHLEAERVSADNVIRTVLEALGSGPEVDPIVRAGEVVAELEHLRRLHEVATERAVALTSAVEQSREIAGRYSWSGLRYALMNADDGPLADRVGGA